MADSTHPTVTPPRSAVLPKRSRGSTQGIPSADAREVIAQRAWRGCVPLSDRLVEKAPKAPRGKAQDDEAIAQVIRRTLQAVVAASTIGSRRKRAILTAFRLLGARCCIGGFTLDQVLDQVQACAIEAVRLLMHRSREVGEQYNARVVDHARYGLRAKADEMTQDLRQELTTGYAAALVWKAPQADRVEVLRAALDDPGWDDTAVPRDARLDELQSVAVFYADGADARQRFDLAAHDAAVLIPTAVDAGSGDRPLHRRVVFAGWSRQTWRDASAMLAAIAERYDLRVRTTVPAPGLRRLSSVYNLLLEGLPRDAARSARPGRITTAATPA